MDLRPSEQTSSFAATLEVISSQRNAIPIYPSKCPFPPHSTQPTAAIIIAALTCCQHDCNPVPRTIQDAP